MLRALPQFSWLCEYSRPIPIHGRNVEVLYTPQDYFSALKSGVQNAKRRIKLSSLYLGTGTREKELVDVLESALSDKSRPDLRCTVLLDHLRGSRGHPNSRSMLQSLVSQYGERFDLCLYHTPNLRGLLKRVGPERFNEVMGLQHMKIYLFDDDLIISGANLSRDYFVDRQDRYVKFRNCSRLADYFSTLVDIVGAHSFSLRPDGATQSPKALSVDPLSSRRATNIFRTSLRESVHNLTTSQLDTTSEETRTSGEMSEQDGGFDTSVFPLLQMGDFGIKQDEIVTERLLQDLGHGETLFLASGYFNLPPRYIEKLLEARGEFRVLAASPEANGFFGGRGVAGHVPYMYMHFAQKFLEALSSHKSEDRVDYLEYFREGWTFHCKGLWYYLCGEKLPSLSLVGSSNYGHRSLTQDLEAQLAVVTTNERLRQALHEEQQRMYCYGRKLTLMDATADLSRKLNLFQWIATVLLKPYV